ncbi:MAG: hydroxymethylglutaryl-CoA lyase [Hyphomicrobiales bacterium]|nr:hydroxymethylglutaryl-CoA lyase [Hyphomicrobiales bacterium]
MTLADDRVEIVEVGPRDGFQPIVPFITTDDKMAFVEGLLDAGVGRIEIGSFVSAKAIPQLCDTRDVLGAFQSDARADFQVLVPNMRGARDALLSQAQHLVFVMSASPNHNRANVGKEPAESAGEFSSLAADLPPATRLRLNVATVFDCPFSGRMPASATLELLKRVEPHLDGLEVCLCDTTGGANPAQVEHVFGLCRQTFSNVSWAFHAHDTYGMGAANVYSAYRLGLRIFDASIGGLGGCPFAPGATGNVATEDLVWMFQAMGVPTGIDIGKIVALAERAAALEGASAGGRVREALSARQRRRASSAQQNDVA